MIEEVQMKDALAKEKLQALASELKQLPDPEAFKQQVESDLWACVVPDDKQNATEVAYEELTPAAQGVIGYIKTDDGDGEVPWWLIAFKWEATTIGEDALTLNSVDNLEQFEDFIVGETTIKKPELLHQRIGVRNDVYGALANFKQISDELAEHMEIRGHQNVDLELPDRIFDISDGQFQTTEAFQTWMTSLVQYCPPFNEQVTALLLVLSQADADLAREVLSDQVAADLKAIGVLGESRVYNDAYFDALGSSGNSLLTDQWQVFDVELPYVNETYDYLAPLEAAFYETWIEENTEFIKQNAEWFILTGGSAQAIESQPAFGQVALRSPIIQKQGRATYCTLSLRSNGRFSTANDQQGRRREINQILKQHGITDDDTR